MKAYKSDQIRNICLVAHSGAGKTSLAEALLFTGKVTDRLGQTAQGNTVMDYDPEEIKRQISISTAVAPMEWNDTKINLLDTPGYFDFEGDVRGALSASDAALIVVRATSDIEVGTEKAWGYAKGMPKLIVVNKVDRENSNYAAVVEKLRNQFGPQVVPITIPIGEEDKFDGVINIIDRKAFYTTGQSAKEAEIPEELMPQVEEYYDMLMEGVAGTDDVLLEKYLNGDPLTPEEIRTGLRVSVALGDVVPVYAVSAFKNIGTMKLLDSIVKLIPPASKKAVAAVNPKSGMKLSCLITVLWACRYLKRFLTPLWAPSICSASIPEP